MRLGEKSLVHFFQNASMIFCTNSNLCLRLVDCLNGPLGTLNVHRPSSRSLGQIYVPSSGEVGCLPIGRSFTRFAASNITVCNSENVRIFSLIDTNCPCKSLNIYIPN